MFIEQAYKGRHEWWRYLVGILIIFFFWQLIGAIPLGFAIVYETMQGTGNIGGLGSGVAAIRKMLDLPPNLFLLLMLIPFACGLLGLYFTVKYLHKQSFKSLTTTRKKIDWKRFFLSFSLIGLYIAASTLIDFYLHPDHYVIQFELAPFLVLLAISIILIPIQTSFEEYLLRGYLMQGIGIVTKTRWVPFVFTSLFFGLLHVFNPEVAQLGPMIMVFYIGIGFFLGILTLMDDGMELSLGFHAANNLVLVLLVTSDWSALQSASILRDTTQPTAIGFEILFPLLVVFPILILIFAKKYKWTNWKEKLFGRVEPPKTEPLQEENPHA